MGRISLFNHVIRSRIVELCYQGYTDTKISELLGINKNTLVNWKRNKPKLKDDMQFARTSSARNLLEVSTRKLASGHKLEEVKTESVELDNEGKPTKVTRTIKEISPDIKAMEMIARKYAPEYSKDYVDIENGESLNLTINYNGMSFADLIEHRKNNNPLDIDTKDYKVIEDNEDK